MNTGCTSSVYRQIRSSQTIDSVTYTKLVGSQYYPKYEVLPYKQLTGFHNRQPDYNAPYPIAAMGRSLHELKTTITCV